MSHFSDASMIQRRQILEDALAEILERHFELSGNGEGERCVVVPGWADDDVQFLPIWTIASELEVKLT